MRDHLETRRDRRFFTGHDIFDYIFHLRAGTSILVTDETFTEGRLFLYYLFKNSGKEIIEVVSTELGWSKDAFAIPTTSLQEASIQLNELRRKKEESVFIHSYLPDMIIRNSSEEVLKVIGFWQKNTKESNNVEFYILPKGAFEEFEKKLMAIVDGCLQISLVKQGGALKTTITPVRSCRREFHLKSLEYKIAEDKLLIEWEGQLTDKIPSEIERLDRIIEMVRTREDSLVIRKGDVNPSTLSFKDQLLISQLVGKRVHELKNLFPEIWNELVNKMANWAVAGYLKVEATKKRHTLSLRSKPKWMNTLFLYIPTRWAYSVFRFRRHLFKRTRTVPLDAHLALRGAMEAFCTILTNADPDSMEALNYSTKFFSEIASRQTALEYITSLNGDPQAKLDIKYVPKIVGITLIAAFGIDADVKEVEPHVYKLTLKDCFLCEGVKSTKPFCENLAAGVIEGSLAVCFKRRFECKEVECKATGHKDCVFSLMLKETETYS